MKPALHIPWDARQRLSMLEEMLRRVVYEQGKGSSQVGSRSQFAFSRSERRLYSPSESRTCFGQRVEPLAR